MAEELVTVISEETEEVRSITIKTSVDSVPNLAGSGSTVISIPESSYHKATTQEGNRTAEVIDCSETQVVEMVGDDSQVKPTEPDRQTTVWSIPTQSIGYAESLPTATAKPKSSSRRSSPSPIRSYHSAAWDSFKQHIDKCVLANHQRKGMLKCPDEPDGAEVRIPVRAYPKKCACKTQRKSPKKSKKRENPVMKISDSSHSENEFENRELGPRKSSSRIKPGEHPKKRSKETLLKKSSSNLEVCYGHQPPKPSKSQEVLLKSQETASEPRIERSDPLKRQPKARKRLESRELTDPEAKPSVTDLRSPQPSLRDIASEVGASKSRQHQCSRRVAELLMWKNIACQQRAAQRQLDEAKAQKAEAERALELHRKQVDDLDRHRVELHRELAQAEQQLRAADCKRVSTHRQLREGQKMEQIALRRLRALERQQIYLKHMTVDPSKTEKGKERHISRQKSDPHLRHSRQKQGRSNRAKSEPGGAPGVAPKHAGRRAAWSKGKKSSSSQNLGYALKTRRASLDSQTKLTKPKRFISRAQKNKLHK